MGSDVYDTYYEEVDRVLIYRSEEKKSDECKVRIINKLIVYHVDTHVDIALFVKSETKKIQGLQIRKKWTVMEPIVWDLLSGYDKLVVSFFILVTCKTTPTMELPSQLISMMTPESLQEGYVPELSLLVVDISFELDILCVKHTGFKGLVYRTSTSQTEPFLEELKHNRIVHSFILPDFNHALMTTSGHRPETKGRVVFRSKTDTSVVVPVNLLRSLSYQIETFTDSVTIIEQEVLKNWNTVRYEKMEQGGSSMLLFNTTSSFVPLPELILSSSNYNIQVLEIVCRNAQDTALGWIKSLSDLLGLLLLSPLTLPNLQRALFSVFAQRFRDGRIVYDYDLNPFTSSKPSVHTFKEDQWENKALAEISQDDPHFLLWKKAIDVFRSRRNMLELSIPPVYIRSDLRSMRYWNETLWIVAFKFAQVNKRDVLEQSIFPLLPDILNLADLPGNVDIALALIPPLVKTTATTIYHKFEDQNLGRVCGPKTKYIRQYLAELFGITKKVISKRSEKAIATLKNEYTLKRKRDTDETASDFFPLLTRRQPMTFDQSEELRREVEE